MKKVLFALLAIVLLIAPISAFAEIDNNATITVALTTIIENEDYMIQGTLNGSGIFQMMFDELIDMNFDTAELIPGLATEWTISDDGCTWHFTLRDDVYFHDGEKLTAEDVKYTYDRMQMDDYNISNTNYLNNQILYDHIDIIDDYHFDFVTKEPVPALLYCLQEVHILPKHYYEPLSADEAANAPILGSGAFIFDEYARDDYVKMHRNENYWGEIPQFETLIYRQIPEEATRIAELETGGIDVAQSISMDQVATINDSGAATVKAVTNGCRMQFQFNANNEKFSYNVRHAINHMINWDIVNQAIFYGMAPRMVMVVNSPWLDPTLTAYEYDEELAAKYLTDDGYTKNAEGKWEKDGEVLSFNIMVYYDQNSERYKVLLALVDQMNQFGLEVEPQYIDRAAILEKLDKREIDDMLYISSCTSYEGQGDLTDLKADSGSNYGCWSNDEFEELYAQLASEFDNDKRAELCYQMERIAYDDAAVVPLWTMIDTWGVSNKVDWNPSPTGRAWMKAATKSN